MAIEIGKQMRSLASTAGNLPGRAPLTLVNRLGCCHANTHLAPEQSENSGFNLHCLVVPLPFGSPFHPLIPYTPFHCSYTFHHCSYFSHFMTRIRHTAQKTVWGSINAFMTTKCRILYQCIYCILYYTFLDHLISVMNLGVLFYSIYS